MKPLSVFDAHVDSLQRALDLGHDLGGTTPGHLDLVRGREGGLGAVVLVAWCDPRFIEGSGRGARARTGALLAEFQALLERHPDQVAFAGDGETLAAANRQGRIAAIAGIEGGHSIEGSLEHLQEFFAQGVRVMTLVWNNHLDWIRSCQDGAGPGVPPGLSSFGRQVVARMNELGILVDLSHAGERSFYDALEVSSAPVMASHSGCRALHDHPRNLSDDQLRALGEQGGVVGIVFCTPFLDAEARALSAEAVASSAFKEIEASSTSPAQAFIDQGEYLQRVLPPLPLERVLDHIVHAVEVAGVEHVGIGSDFDGILHRPQGLEDAACYPALAAGLARRGFDEREVAAILGGNLRRVFAAATGAATQAGQMPLSPINKPG